MSGTPGFDLVAAAQTGDTDAYADLWRRYQPVVHRFVAGKIRDRGTAEDITSETFLLGWRNIATVRDQGRDVGAWFVTIARNLVATHYRRTSTHTVVLPRTPIDEIAAALADPEPDPETTVTADIGQATLTADVAAYLNRLPARYQECLRLRFYAELTGREMGAELNLTDHQARRLQHRATGRLRQLIGAYQTTAAFAAADHRTAS